MLSWDEFDQEETSAPIAKPAAAKPATPKVAATAAAGIPAPVAAAINAVSPNRYAPDDKDEATEEQNASAL
jgi:hypothetical protein